MSDQLSELRAIFPELDDEILAEVLSFHHGDVHACVEALLTDGDGQGAHSAELQSAAAEREGLRAGLEQRETDLGACVSSWSPRLLGG